MNMSSGTARESIAGSVMMTIGRMRPIAVL
jgi:hypothetical protein